MTPSDTSLPPHLFTFYADFAKTTLTLSVTSIGILVAFSNSILDVPERMAVVVLVGLTLFLLILVAGISIVVIGLVSKAIRGIRVGVVPDLAGLLNGAFWCLISAALVFISAGVVRLAENGTTSKRNLALPASISLKALLHESLDTSFVQCKETPVNRITQIDLSPDGKFWVIQIITTCPSEPGTPLHKVELTIDFGSTTVTKVRFP
jgi:hypothetical protein